MSLVEGRRNDFAAWETDGQVHFGVLDAERPLVSAIRAPSGEPRPRKHPRLAVGAGDQLLMVWTERTAWARGGNIAWQLFGSDGQTQGPDERQAGLPVWSFASPVPRADGGLRSSTDHLGSSPGA